MSDQATDLRWAAATLRRRSRVLAAAALVGLVAGVAYVIFTPPPLTSTALVLLPTPALAEDSTSDVETQVQIALSATVLERAGQAAVPALPARSVKKMVQVTAPTNQLIQIQATSANPAQARTVSQAVADSYVGYVTNTAREVTAAALADLNVRRYDLEAQIKQLQVEISATMKRQKAGDPESAEGRRDAQLLAGLRTQQADLWVQLDKVKDMIATGGPVGSVTGAGTAVVQPATEARGFATLLRLLIWASIGAVVFTILAAGVLLVTARRDQRLRLRDEIADAVGSPVLAAVRSMPQPSVAGWSTLLATYQATPVESWAFRQVLRALVPQDRKREPRTPGRIDHPASISVLSLAGDRQGLAIGLQLAAFISTSGITTRLSMTMGSEAAASLLGVSAIEHEVSLRPGLYVGDEAEEETIDVAIDIVVLERPKPDLGDARLSEAMLLSVAAGTATEQELARVAVAVDDAGRRIDGIVVADPDGTDRTSGRHTMDERSLQPLLPTRLTGVGLSDSAASARKRSRS
jgi:Chain length determinant protein